jgi:DNA invertase Pin-like site-specific DNA recombinase
MALYGYLRVSTAEQADGTSLASQEAVLHRRAADRGASVVRMFTDAGVSGSVPLGERPAGGEMLGCLQPGDVIVAAKLNRLFRSAADALSTVEALKARGVGVILADMGSEPVTENGVAKLFFTMLAAFAEFERDRIKERQAEGQRRKREAGGHVSGSAPFGYRVVGRGKQSQLEPVEAEQAAIRRMRALRSEGASLRAISTAMKAEGFAISHTAVERVLRETAAR